MTQISGQEGRPLSPHLQVYRPQLTSVLSISHRITGIFLSLGAVVLAGWVIAAAGLPEFYLRLTGHLGAWYGQIALFGWSLCLFYHLCNGIRHLFWDAGYGFELKTTYASGYAVVAASLLLTGGVWLFIWI